MKVLFYCDPHFRETSSYPLFNRVQENGLTGELNNLLLGFDFVREQIIKYEPDLVINLGDTYHKDNLISIRTLHGASLGLKKVSSICKDLEIDHLILMGNHDIYALLEDGTTITSLCSLEAHGMLITEQVSYSLGKNFRIFLMPYVDSIEEAYQGILEGSNRDLIAAHMDFIGSVHDNGHLVEVGLDPHVATPVICGHIHLRQTIGNVVYPGSLVQNRFTRDNLEDAGGVMLYDVDTGENEIIQNYMSRHFIKIKDFNTLDNLDPERCIVKIFSEVPEEEVKDLLEGFQYMYVRSKTQEESNRNFIRNEIDRPEKLLRSFIADDKPEYVDIYDEVIK